MTLPSKPCSGVFCDWLDVTAPPSEEQRITSELGLVFGASDGLKLADGLYEVGAGKVKLGTSRGVYRVSLSGASIRMLEVTGLWADVLSVLGSWPHRVTRLDAALDMAYDGADAIEALQGSYPRGEVRLTQRPIKVTEMLCTRPDGRKTGTWYAGHRSGAEVTCRVYDKAQQLLDTRGESGPPMTRVELTVRKGPGPTLRDAYEPERIFWHFVAPAILKRPESVPDWSNGWAEGWRMERSEILPMDALKRRIEYSGELASIIELADALGPFGRQMAVRLIADKLGVAKAMGLRRDPSSLRGSAGPALSAGSKAAH